MPQHRAGALQTGATNASRATRSGRTSAGPALAHLRQSRDGDELLQHQLVEDEFVRGLYLDAERILHLRGKVLFTPRRDRIRVPSDRSRETWRSSGSGSQALDQVFAAQDE